MKPVVKLALAALGLIILGSLGVIASGWFLASGCENTEQQRVPSPNGRFELVIFERNCGATTDFSTQVSLVDRGAKLIDRPGNAYVSEDRADLEVSWTADTLATIHSPAGVEGELQAWLST